MRAFWIIGIACSLCLSFACPSFAVTRYVDVSNATPASPFTNWGIASTNIQMAINDAVSGDEILVAPGTYRLSGNPVLIPEDKTLTLRSTQSRAAIIDAQKLSYGLWIRGSNSVVEGFTVRNGVNAAGSPGGVEITTACTVRDCLVTSNRAYGAGGIEIYANGAVVENCTIQSNLATYFGGGVIFYGATAGLLQNCIVSDNIASNYGGGVFCQSAGTVSNCWISGNRSILEDGGGVYMSNQGTTNGGTLINSVVYSNRAGQYGGGVYSVGPAGTLAPIINCTVVSNTAAQDGGGIFAYTTRLINNIIYGNSAPTNANLNSNGSSSIVSNCCVTPAIGGAPTTNAPTFVDAVAQNFHLATASSCIDAGTTNGAPRNDIEGNPRPRIGKPGTSTTNCDVGAYEYGFHFNDIRFSNPNTVQLLWDVQDRGIYKLDVETNGTVSPPWIMGVAGYTNPSMASYQFMVHTQTIVIPAPVPADANFRLRISHTLGK